jgi:hypothetical protein
VTTHHVGQRAAQITLALRRLLGLPVKVDNRAETASCRPSQLLTRRTRELASCCDHFVITGRPRLPLYFTAWQVSDLRKRSKPAGARSGNRTRMSLRTMVFETIASACSAIRAGSKRHHSASRA